MGALRPEVWKRWLAWDPARMAARRAGALRAARLVYVDRGLGDEFSLHWGSRMLVSALSRRGVRVRHEEFDDGHMNITYRYDVSLPLLARALTS